jgi:hypothetical protein
MNAVKVRNRLRAMNIEVLHASVAGVTYTALASLSLGVSAHCWEVIVQIWIRTASSHDYN